MVSTLSFFYSLAPRFVACVQATDIEGNFSESLLRIQVTDVNDAAIFGVVDNYAMSTSGGQDIKISGIEFGATDFKLSNGGSSASVTAKLNRGIGETIDSGACDVSVPNTEITCKYQASRQQCNVRTSSRGR